MRYLIGFDGGGTKTAVCAASLNDFSLRRAETTGSSWREYGASKVAEILKKAAFDLVGEGRIAGIAMGLPCYGESADGDLALEQAVNKVFPDTPIYFTNDVEVGWAGSLALDPGINIVAGTGAISFGKDKHGKSARCGGWSEFFSDEGSCYWMGRKVLELFSKQADGRLPKDALYEAVCRKFNLKDDFDIIDIIHEEYIPTREKMAGLQMLAKEAAIYKSEGALSLYAEAVRELCLMAAALRDQLDFGGEAFTVSYTGGLFKAGELVIPLFSQEVEKLGGKLSPPRFSPEEGALLLAFAHFYPDSLEQAKISIERASRL